MKANKKSQRYMTHMEKGGRISWPVGLTNWNEYSPQKRHALSLSGTTF
ncbi:hypothetical protein [Herbaspirillum huttiense]